MFITSLEFLALKKSQRATNTNSNTRNAKANKSRFSSQKQIPSLPLFETHLETTVAQRTAVIKNNNGTMPKKRARICRYTGNSGNITSL
mmetsp:Transcript_5853/g.8425  ORF Transcript_5853/g.8425 Transcript_5853/m.8425 type:complete len:89 (-) Transcript_5853:12-278(-)